MSSHKQRDQVLARLALHISQAELQLTSPPPTTEELALLLDKRLDFSRRNEIYEHLNQDSELFQQWITLVEANSLNCTEASDSNQIKSSLFKSYLLSLQQILLGWQGAAALTTLVAIVGVSWLLNPNPINPQQAVPTPQVAAQQSVDNIKQLQQGFLIALTQLPTEQQTALGFPLAVTPPLQVTATTSPLGAQLVQNLKQCAQQPELTDDNGYLTQLQSHIAYAPSQAPFCSQLQNIASNLFNMPMMSL